MVVGETPFSQNYAQDQDEENEEALEDQIHFFGDGQHTIYLTKEDQDSSKTP